jgi:hypothetical protein
MKQVIIISGKANQVFKYVDLLKRHKGNINIKELAKGNKTIKLDFRS